MKQIYETLCGICGAAHVLVREPMSRHTTFRTGGPADLLVQPEAEQIAPILEVCRNEEIPWTVIGNGSKLPLSGSVPRCAWHNLKGEPLCRMPP